MKCTLDINLLPDIIHSAERFFSDGMAFALFYLTEQGLNTSYVGHYQAATVYFGVSFDPARHMKSFLLFHLAGKA